ncbi:MAG: 50S ribosomal protein L25 [Deltaproteobacteria bacterium TMED58]|nr:50S ribosomal protein L25 [Deltaproteobacteria bacterium TMED58]
MIIVEMNAIKRDELGKQANNKIRKSGLVPAVVYGRNKENLNISIDGKELKKVLSGTESRENTIISISVEGLDQKRKVLLKEAHLDTLTSAPLHFDFYEITDGEKLKLVCPLNFIGKPEGVKNGGVIQTLSNQVTIECVPEKIPNEITVDISSMNIGDTLFVSDLPSEEGVTILSNPKSTTISILAPRVVTEETTETEGTEEGEEGKEGEEGSEPQKEESDKQ